MDDSNNAADTSSDPMGQTDSVGASDLPTTDYWSGLLDSIHAVATDVAPLIKTFQKPVQAPGAPITPTVGPSQVINYAAPVAKIGLPVLAVGALVLYLILKMK